MGHTYGESWAFFHDTPDVIQQPLQSGTACNSISRYTGGSDAEILAEIRGLQQELEERRRSQQPEVTLERAAQTSQRPSAPTNLFDPSLEPNRQPSSDLPRCWDPCCNGRTFSNNSNLARHQREKRGGDANLKCSFCGVGFSRSSAKKVHETERRCRNIGGSAVG